MHMSACVFIHMYMCIYTHIYVYVYVYVYIYVYMYICVYTYIYVTCSHEGGLDVSRPFASSTASRMSWQAQSSVDSRY